MNNSLVSFAGSQHEIGLGKSSLSMKLRSHFERSLDVFSVA